MLQVSNTALQDKLDWSEKSIGDLLLEPTVIYVRSVMKLAKEVNIKVPPISEKEIRLSEKKLQPSPLQNSSIIDLQKTLGS